MQQISSINILKFSTSGEVINSSNYDSIVQATLGCFSKNKYHCKLPLSRALHDDDDDDDSTVPLSLKGEHVKCMAVSVYLLAYLK